jgi:hypothetical protein
MATQQPLRLTRNQLAQFLKDQEQIRAFEALFAIVEPLTPDTVSEVSQEAGSAFAAAVAAQDQVHAVEQSIGAMLAACEAKATQALQQVQQMEHIAQLVQTWPAPREFKTPRYGVFYDTTTQTAAAINTAYAITFNTTDIALGVSRGTPTSRITVDREGIYNFQFSAQLDNTSGGNHLAFIWCRVNGADVAQSASQIRLKGTDGELVAAWNFVLSLKAGDYFQLMWSVNDTSVQILAQAASAPVPAIPSVILTVTNNIQGQT